MRVPLFASLVMLVAVKPAQAQELSSEAAPPTSVHYLQYGVALAAEFVASAGDVCARGAGTCILGSGGGLALRVGYRSRAPWYVGGAYEFSRQNSANLLRLAILQQLRAETRYYFDAGKRGTPYLSGGVGAVLYGNEWGSDTGGITTFLGVGLEFQISESAVLGAGLAYRALLLRGWTDTTEERRADRYLGFGLAHMIAFEVVLEIRESLPRW